jgi:uncharacterized membrane protein
MMSSTLLALPTLFVALIAVLQWLMPRLTRRDLAFAVTVNPSFSESPEARAIERRYRIGVALAAAFALAATIAAASHPLTLPVGLLVQLAGGTFAFLRARQETLPYAVTPSLLREASLWRPDAPLPAVLHLGPFVILGGAALWLHSLWDKLPERLPMHWNFVGQVDRWADKSVPAVYGPALTGTAVCLMLWLLGRTVGRGRRVAATGEGARGEAIFRRRMQGILLASEFLVASTFALVVIPIAGGPMWPVAIAPAVSLVFIVGMVIVLARTGQGGSRLAPATGFGDRTADAHWKWGMIYVNRDDPALFVEKRFGIGYTINFARPAAWGLFLLITFLPLIGGLLARFGRR